MNIPVILPSCSTYLHLFASGFTPLLLKKKLNELYQLWWEQVDRGILPTENLRGSASPRLHPQTLSPNLSCQQGELTQPRPNGQWPGGSQWGQ